MPSWLDFTDMEENIEMSDYEYVPSHLDQRKMYCNQSKVFSGTLLCMNMSDFIESSQIR